MPMNERKLPRQLLKKMDLIQNLNGNKSLKFLPT
jgi:hypothetical protein